MSAWALRLAAALSTTLVFVGAISYTAAHVKNAAAPLQPPVAPSASAAPATAGASNSGGRPAPTATPRLTLAPGVRGATLPPITFTRVS